MSSVVGFMEEGAKGFRSISLSICSGLGVFKQVPVHMEKEAQEV